MACGEQATDNVVMTEDLLRRPVTPGRRNTSQDQSQQPPSSTWEPCHAFTHPPSWLVPFEFFLVFSRW